MTGVAQIRARLAEAGRWPDGRAKTELVEALAERAKAERDRALEADVLLQLSECYTFGGGSDRQPVVFARLLKIYDEFPAELGGHTHTIHWRLKWLAGSLLYNPAVPLPAVRKWLDEFESRYRQRGYSLRPVLSRRSDLAMLAGDTASARAFMDASIAAPRDEMANCEACERNSWGDLHVDLGEDEAACQEWAPVLAGRLRCRQEPARVLAAALMPLVRLGRLDEARSAHLRGYQLARSKPGLRTSVGHHIEFCALTGNEARGLEILTEHKDWLIERHGSGPGRRDFSTSALVLLRRLADLGLDDVRIGSETVASLLEQLPGEVERSCARFDARNGSSFISDGVARRLAAEPTGDWLPLGFSPKLPERVVRAERAPQVTPVKPAEQSVRAPLKAAYDALVRQDSRSADEIERFAESVEAELAAAVRQEDWGAAAGCHLMLAQSANWRQDPETAPRHLSSAMELYVSAGQPCRAAVPALSLARFYLDRDPARAESYARQGLELGGSEIKPKTAARLGSLLVDALSRQPGRESDLIDAALRASARWQGISEPDELRLTFTAARAYHAQGCHAEAAALFGEAMPRVELAYEPYVAALTRKAYGESLRALQEHKAAAEQLLIAARLLEEQPESKAAYAQVSWSAAEALAASGNPKSAIAAYEKAVELWRELGAIGPLARCRRAVAWLYLREHERGRALMLMREAREELREAAEAAAPEAAAELAETEKQLRRMTRERPEA